MADNVILNPGAGGSTIATDDIGGVQHELVKVEFGSDGAATMVDASNPLPVTDAVAEAALNSIAAEDFATHAAQIDNSQKTQLVDAAGNQVTVTGNKLDVNATFSGDIEIGSVELKNATTDDRAAVINADPTTEFGLVTRNIPSGTQPVSAASLPLPSGASTEATLALIKAKTDNIDVALSTRTKPSDQQHVIIDSGSGGATTVADGANVVEGSTTDAAVVTDANGTISGKLRGLVKILATWIGSLGQKTMANSAPIVIASDQTAIPVSFSGSPAVDNTSLYSATLSVTGAITGIDTTGYESLILQLSDVWVGKIMIEGSADNSNWQPLLFMNVNDVSMLDNIVGNGVYQLKATTKFVRLNVIQISGSVTAIMLGRIGMGINGADRLSLAMDRQNNTPLYVAEIETNKDINKSLIPSDAPKAIYGTISGVGQQITIDTTGYQSLSLQVTGTWVATLQLTASNDGINFITLTGSTTLQNAIPQSTFTANTLLLFPCYGKYIRITMNAYTSGVIQVFAYLRQTPATAYVSSQNLAFINGSATTNFTAGTLAVTGAIAVGAGQGGIPPLIMGSSDSGGLARRVLSDTAGRLIINNSQATTDQSGTVRALGSLAPAASIFNVASLAVQDTAQFEGQSLVELLGQMLLELRINNQLLSELPTALQSQNGRLDEPALFRNEQSIFAN